MSSKKVPFFIFFFILASISTSLAVVTFHGFTDVDYDVDGIHVNEDGDASIQFGGDNSVLNDGGIVDGVLKPGGTVVGEIIEFGDVVPKNFIEGAAGDLSSGGEWRMLQQSIGISAMHMQLLPGGKLIIFDRTDFGRSNLSLPEGNCRTDPNDLALKYDCTAHSVLFDVASSDIRPLNILTDTWCSSGTLLSNGSLLQTGGFNDGDRAVRTFDPMSSPDAATTDWVEHPGYLSARRWYASNQILPDGRVVVVGGRRQFNYEFFPRQEQERGGSSLVPFGFLLETRDGPRVENNLYPFLHLLPDGTLFIFANTRAVILDFRVHRVVRRLPPITDDVPRCYPSSGSSVLLRLTLPVLSPEVLICGGAPRGAYESALNKTFVQAALTCGRIALAVPVPVWTMEEMPMPRVMGDMVLLPTGDVLIINGAAAGTAGWELGREPVLNPVLYRPGLPEGSRFSVLRKSSIPRLYHSTAVLDTSARVLVGGSNPHVRYNFKNVTYPTELSIEAFHPPYMDERLFMLRPRIIGLGVDSTEAELTYGNSLGVRFVVGVYREPEAVEVVVVAPGFVTHAVAMNQRAVVLLVERVAPMGLLMYEAEVKVPPSPEIAPPGYYMLFVVHARVPGEGVWVRIAAQ